MAVAARLSRARAFIRAAPWRTQRRALLAALALAALLAYGLLLSAPYPFPQGAVVAIPPGASALAAAQALEGAGVVRYAPVVRAIVRLAGGSRLVRPGQYRFVAPQGVFVVAWRIVNAEYGIPQIRLTAKEGETVRNIAARVAESFPNIRAEDFRAAAAPYEGYLFPDTYFFNSDARPVDIVSAMRDNFARKIAPMDGAIARSSHARSEIVILASLIEKEARSSAARAMIAGILENRLALGMPLQVDAVFGYIFNRETYAPSLADLSVDSPYNTYTHRGLPPGPIDNPGLDALTAALNPTKSAYLYYLTGTDGAMHYAKTYAGQLANQRAYLK